jgi:hypothetical protein
MRPCCTAFRSFLLVALAATVTSAAAFPPTASRAELQRWFVATQSSRAADLGVPQRWEFDFVAADSRSLEGLSAELVRRGYTIAALEDGPTPLLRVTKVELHSPVTLVELNKALQSAARTHGARYLSFGLAK